jgi:ribonuclease P protein component
VLPASVRMTRSLDFETTVRRGRRSSSGRVVVHALESSLPQESGAGASGDDPVRVGFIVSKAVGNAVVRHRVARRLRHVVGGHLELLAPGSMVVVRALPNAAGATSASLDRDVVRALGRARADLRDVSRAGAGRP